MDSTGLAEQCAQLVRQWSQWSQGGLRRLVECVEGEAVHLAVLGWWNVLGTAGRIVGRDACLLLQSLHICERGRFMEEL